MGATRRLVTRRLGDGRYSFYTKLGEFILARGEREYVRGKKGLRGRHVNYWTVEKAPPTLPYDFGSPLKAESKNDLIALIVRKVAVHQFVKYGWDGQPQTQSVELERLEKQLSDALRVNEMQAKVMGTMQTFIDQQARFHEFELRQQGPAPMDSVRGGAVSDQEADDIAESNEPLPTWLRGAPDDFLDALRQEKGGG